MQFEENAMLAFKFSKIHRIIADRYGKRVFLQLVNDRICRREGDQGMTIDMIVDAADQMAFSIGFFLKKSMPYRVSGRLFASRGRRN
jgi:hypothetical protein